MVVGNKLLLEIYRLTRESLYYHQIDAMGCCDEIIRNYKILNSRKLRVSNNVYKIHCNTYDNMTCKN